MKKTHFGNGKLINWRINWRTIFKKREKDSEGKNQQDAQGQQEHSSIAINSIDREPSSSTSAGRENISPEIISALNGASSGTTRIIPTNAPCETLAAVAPSPAFPELIVSPPDTATIKEGKDTTLSERSRAGGQEVKVEGSGHWRLWDQAYGELINDKKSAGLMEGYKTLLNGNLKPEDKDYRDPARHDLMASLIKEKLEIMSKDNGLYLGARHHLLFVNRPKRLSRSFKSFQESELWLQALTQPMRELYGLVCVFCFR
jgi:hypothetical protein